MTDAPFDAWRAMRDAAGRLHGDQEMIRALTVFVDFWGLDSCTPPAAVEKNVRDLVQVFAYAAKTAAEGMEREELDDDAPAEASEGLSLRTHLLGLIASEAGHD